jgi:hypothetical protein
MGAGDDQQFRIQTAGGFHRLARFKGIGGPAKARTRGGP